ncbi:putative CRISPR-associated protein [Vibrio halioticoli NBRC 102217]|uniref:Putative CRISPR-associated protein n=1 Tax=Vibrio halioticoli NBRC 102217 TaxID=1219072 RepID=V5F439_9VIBR|nr:type I-E CRISPR-associated protein Cas5/CasD [Vibrio halioticoli]GAD89979.1 putative CRISPR-associated protein [Vibrio halioticoli NBRC 102217]
MANLNQQTLLLKTEGMSAYGLQTFDVHRRANHFPTRSGIIGLLGAAMGIKRSDHHKLYQLSQEVLIAVQVNNAGTKITDYHTVQNFRSPQGKIQKGTKPTYRDYWCDSEHTFAITGEKSLIVQLSQSVRFPTFTLFQGRKSCPLTRPLYEGICIQNNPVEALLALEGKGQIFSDQAGQHQVATLQVRDLITATPRKYAMRTVYVCSRPEGGE